MARGRRSPAGEVDAGLLGGILRDKFGAGLSSISDEQLNHKAKFTIVGVKPAEYDRSMKQTRQHTARLARDLGRVQEAAVHSLGA